MIFILTFLRLSLYDVKCKCIPNINICIRVRVLAQIF